MALKSLIVVALLAALAGCGQIDRLLPGAAALGEPLDTVPRAAIEKAGQPVLRVRVPSRGIDALLTRRDSRGGIEAWEATDGSLFTFRSGVLIETRGLGADLMSAAAPSASQVAGGSGWRRSYFFVAADDQTGRRDYACAPETRTADPVTIYGRSHATTRVAELCQRPEGRITNTFWLEGGVIRKSREWVSPAIGHAEFERVVD